MLIADQIKERFETIPEGIVFTLKDLRVEPIIKIIFF